MKYIVAKYLRISAEDIDLDGFDKFESNSIANQRALLDDFIGRVPEFAGCEIIEALDDGRTGTNFLRPGVQKLIEMAQSGKVHCIVVKDLSRWGRNYLEVGDFLEQKFPAWGVRFISLNDCYDSAKLNGATGGIDIAFRNLIYDLYSQDLSEKVRSAKISAAKSGKYTNALAFYGYVKDLADPRRLVIDEPAAEIVRRMFDLTLHGKSSTQIAKILNDEQAPTAQERKIAVGSRRRWKKDAAMFWYGSIISCILRDERYTGKLIYGRRRAVSVGQRQFENVPRDEWIIVPGAIPAIITQEQYDEAQLKVSERRPEGKMGQKNLLFTRKLKCGHCGMGLKAIHRLNDVKYQCNTPKTTDKYGCPEYRLFEKDIAAAVLAALQQQVAFADNARRMLIERTEQLTPDIEKLQAEVAHLQKLIEKTKTAKMGLWEKYQSGAISAEAFQRENEQADDRIVKHTARIPEIQDEILRLESETGRENLFVERFSKQVGITELTRAVVEEFISVVRVYSPERIEVIFNYADEYERVATITNVSAGEKTEENEMSLLIQEMPGTSKAVISPLFGDKTVIYCRTANGGNEAIERQKEMIMRYSMEQGYQVDAVYSDCNESGVALSRPSMQMLLNDVRSGQVSRVIVTDLARLCRNLLHFHELICLFEDCGVELIAVKDGGAVNVCEAKLDADALMKFVREHPNGMRKRKQA